LGRWLIDVSFAANSMQYATDCLTRDYAPGAAFADVASGLLVVPLARGGRDMLLWFRAETMQTVNWAGDPKDKPMVTGPNGPRLTPRTSFDLFVESVRGRSHPWMQVELESAAILRLQLLETVVENAEQRSILNAELAGSNEELDAFKYVASHDLKEPLRGIHQYAYQLMEDATLQDDKSRNKVDRMLRLTRRMDSLLDSLLHFSRIDKTGRTLEVVDLNAVVAEALEMAGPLTDGQVELVMPRSLPPTQCNRGWCRDIFVRLLSNAITFNHARPKRIEVGYIAEGEIHPRPGCPQGSEGYTIYTVADNGIGIQAKYFAQIFKLFKRLHGRDEYGGGTGTGLTVVRKMVERHGGKIWLDSRPGNGTTFYFTLPTPEAR
jgi:chemotaxis family two-component system sensor kinase Cph1